MSDSATGSDAVTNQMSKWTQIPPCFCCGKSMEPSCPHEASERDPFPQLGPPLDGADFQAVGNYGSSLFDPMNDEKLHIVICDDCLRKHKSRVLWCRERFERRAYTCAPWDPDTGNKESLGGE